MFFNQGTSITYKRIWSIAYPIIIGSVAQNIINVTDTAFLGRLGETALGGGAIGGLFYMAFLMFGWGFGIGTQIVVARRYGEGVYRPIGRTVGHGFLFLFGLALVLFSLIKFFGSSILSQIVKSVAVRDTSIDYLSFMIWGIFFAHTNFIFRAFYVGIGRTRVITVTTLVMVCVNVFLDYSLIFGNFGFPAMGVSGAALASVIAEISCTLSFIVYTTIKIPVSKYRLFNFKVLSRKLLLRLLRISIPMMFQNFFAFSVWFFFFLIIEKMGESQLAISNIIRSIYIVLLIPIMGFASTTNTLVSYVIGQGRKNEVLATIGKIAVICVLGVIVIVGACAIIPEQIISIYTSDQQLIQMGIPVLYVISVSSILFGFGFILFSGVSGTGKTKVSFFIEIQALVVYLVYAIVMVMVFKASIAAVWSVEILYGLLLSMVSLIYLKSKRWMGAKV
jgi:putative MATE family efflux protein